MSADQLIAALLKDLPSWAILLAVVLLLSLATMPVFARWVKR